MDHSHHRLLFILLLIALLASLTGCVGLTGSTQSSESKAQVSSLAIQVGSSSLAVGATEPVSVTAHFSDGTSGDVTSQATLSSSAPSVVSVANATLTGVAAGNATLTATLNTVSTTLAMSVGGSGGMLTAITLSPATTTIFVASTQQFTATGTYSDGSKNDLTSQVTWSSSATAMVTVNNTGLATGVSNGSATITATLNGISGSAAVTIAPPPTLQSITITPANPTITVGANQQFVATGHYTDGSTRDDTNNVSWTSSANNVATISSAGLASGLQPGTTTITANSGSVLTSTGMTVVAGSGGLISITISPDNWTLPVGSTQQYTATGRYSDGSTQDLTATVTWGITPANLATITAGGLVTAKAAGAVTVNCAFNGLSDTASLTVTSSGGGGGGSGNFLTWQFDQARDGANLSETTLTLQNVNTSTFGKLYQFMLDGDPYAQPLYASGLTINGTTRNVLFVATEHDSVYAFDADGNTLQPLWHTSFIDPAAGVTTLQAPGDTAGASCCPAPEVGITGTPVIDLSTKTLFVLVRTKENGTQFQRLHALDITTGNDLRSAVVTASVPGNGDGGTTVNFNSSVQNQRSGLALSNGIVWVSWASHSDKGQYHGWMIGYDETTMQPVGVFNSTPNGWGGGVWMSGSAPAAIDSEGFLYFVTGNGDFGVKNSNYAMSFIKLTPQGKMADFFTPFDWETLNDTDLDIAGAGVMLLPDQPGPHTHELVQADKNGTIYLLDRDNLGQYNSTDNSQVVQTIRAAFPDILRSSPAYWNGFVYWAGLNDKLKAYQLSNGLLSTKPVLQGSMNYGFPGATPSISGNGNQNVIVWTISNDGHATLRASNATTLQEIYNSKTSRDDSGSNYVRFLPPTVINGKVFVGTGLEQTNSVHNPPRITVYGLLK